MGIHLPPAVASCLTLAFIAFLFRRDIREKPNISGALWLPLLWLMPGCSRSLSEWLNILGLPVSGGASVEEASPSFRNCPQQRLAHRFFALLFHFHCLVRFSLRGFQAVDQNSRSSDHGA